VQLLEPEHDLAQVVTLGSSWSLPSAQSVGFTHAPAATPHMPPSSVGGTDASLAPPALPPEPPEPPDPVEPAEPDELEVVASDDVLDVLVEPDAVVEPDEVAELVLPEPPAPPPVVVALVPPLPGVSLLPPHATSAAPKSQDTSSPPNHRLVIAMLLENGCREWIARASLSTGAYRIGRPASSAICSLSTLPTRSARELGARADSELSEEASYLIGNSANFRAANASDLPIGFAAQ
jgi:hypothetical protein